MKPEPDRELNLHSPQRQLIELRMEHADLDSLIDHSAGIRRFHHAVQRHPDAGLAVEYRPIDRRASAIFRQQRTVHIPCPERRQREDLGPDHVPVINR